MLDIQLLGGFQIHLNGKPISGLTKPRGRSLLAYLILHHEIPQERAHLAYTFWPDSSDKQARTNLRRELHHLRQIYPLFDDALLSDTQTIQWLMPPNSALDTQEFCQLVQVSTNQTPIDANSSSRIQNLNKAIALYQGEFLPGLYDEWIIAEREKQQQLFIQALEVLTQLLAADRDYTAAITTTQRLLQHDPLYEAGYLRLMELYAHQNDRAHALHAYHACTSILERELGAPPSREIEEAYQRLLQADVSPATQRLLASTSLSQLVGRKSEWQMLLSAWRATIKGHPSMVLIEGEAGIGKSRLAEELLAWVNRQGITTARTRSYAAEGSLAYAPVIEWLRSDALTTMINSLDSVWLTELARLLPELLVEQPNLPPPEPMTEERQRQRLFEALARVFTASSQPLLLLIDDLQWCEKETLEWLRFLLRFDAAAPIFVVGTERSEEVDDQHPLHSLITELHISNQLAQIELEPLTANETTELAIQEEGSGLDESALEQVFQESEGNPLFVVEMVRAGHFSSAEPRDSESGTAELPPKVYAVIQHRLAQLSPMARSLSSVAATIGRAFSYELLVAASDCNEDEVVNGLDELWRRRIVREQKTGEYDFGHDRIREAAYAALSPVWRKRLHRRVAQALEALYANNIGPISGQLALHNEKAGLLAQAVDWYQRASQTEQKLFAHFEAIAPLESGIALLDKLPENDKYEAQKTQMLLELDRVVGNAYGIALVRRKELLLQVYDLATRRRDNNSLAETLHRMSFFYQCRGEYKEARKIADEHLMLVKNSGDRLQRNSAYLRSGTIDMSLGKFTNANYAFEQARSLLDQCDERLRNQMVWKEHSSQLDRYRAIVLWILGYPEKAQDIARRMILLSPELGPVHRSNIPFFAAILYRNLKLSPELSQQVQNLTIMGEEYGMQLAQQSGMVFSGWVLTHQGKVKDGIALTQLGVNGFRSMGHTVFQTHRLAMLIEMHLMIQEVDEAQLLLDEAFTLSQKKGESFWDVELHRLQGEVFVIKGASDEKVEACYQRALAISQRQASRSLGLRASISLCRLWQRHGKYEEARHMLQEIYDWFTEGFDTSDLMEAKSLLQRLSKSSSLK